LTQKLPNFILFSLIQECILQYHVNTSHRYDDNCTVWCQI